MTLEKYSAKKEGKYVRSYTPLERVRNILLGEYELLQLNTTRTVKPELVERTINKIHKSLQIVHSASGGSLKRRGLLDTAVESLEDVGRVLDAKSEGYDPRAHQLLWTINGPKIIAETNPIFEGVTGKQLLTVLGALGVAFRTPEHAVMRENMMKYFPNTGGDFDFAYSVSMYSLLGLTREIPYV
ncbi:MAG: hypothetical protein ABII80_00295 [bacterium]